MAAPTKILELVERFDRNLRAYKQGPYHEAQARIEFIDPFFAALGWRRLGSRTRRPRSSGGSR